MSIKDPYHRSYTVGRFSEQQYNKELHEKFEATKHLLDVPEEDAAPQTELDGAVWLDRVDNELKYYVKSSDTWKTVFKDKFRIVDENIQQMPPTNPVIGQMWFYNDVLMYFNGYEWRTAKALVQDASQFNISVFSNFSFTSPLWKIGNTIIEDEDIENYRKYLREYLQGKLDKLNETEMLGDGTKWNFDTENVLNGATLDDLDIQGKNQFLVPNINVDRIFAGSKIDFNYDTVSEVCIQYEKNYIKDIIPSMIHINPGRLRNITKTLVKIDRDNPLIQVSAANTEYYGFKEGDIHGKLLLPMNDPTVDMKRCNYECTSDGIYLTYETSRAYDYILAITYDFSWIRATGSLNKITNKEKINSYYISNYVGHMNVFVDGFDLEYPYYEDDNISKTITVAEDTDKHELSVMSSPMNEFGFVRTVDLNGRAVIKHINNFVHPLVFLAGEAMSSFNGDVEFSPADNYVYVKGGKRNMPWCIIELYDAKNDYDMNMVSGFVEHKDSDNEAYIQYDSSSWLDTDTPVLFINGLLIKKEEIILDKENNKIKLSSNNFKVGQEYILLQDRYGRLYDENKMLPAISTGHLSESLVYHNSYLICNDNAVKTTEKIEDTLKAENISKHANNEVKMFISGRKASGDYIASYKIWNKTKETWDDMLPEDISIIETFSKSYSNTSQSIELHFEVNKEDVLDIYAYNYANDIESPLIIRNIPCSYQEFDEYQRLYAEALESGNLEDAKVYKKVIDEALSERNSFQTPEGYVHGKNELSVWVNGIRQYNVIEKSNGMGFDLPEKVRGIVTYVIERTENGNENTGEREILDRNNIIPNTINVYRTNKSLYPGRVVIYINGLRQSQDTYTILDNHTIIFRDKNTKLIGAADNFPDEILMTKDLKEVTLHHYLEDLILVEIKNDCKRTENHIVLDDEELTYNIPIEKYDLPVNLIDSQDEILIFVNGLFFGLRDNIGYVKDITTDSIKILDYSTINKLYSDPLYIYMEEHPEEKYRYAIEHDGIEYKPQKKDIVFDWR